jgi:hypothetical protein
VLGLLEEPGIGEILGVDLAEARRALDALDREALATVGVAPGVDVPPLEMHGVPARPTLRTVLKDRMRMTPTAKSVLQDVGRPLRRGGTITAGQVLARLVELRPPDPAAALFEALGVDVERVRLELAAPGSGG